MKRLVMLVCFLFMAAPLNVAAQDYFGDLRKVKASEMMEHRMLTIAIGSVVGGGPDTSARLLAKHLPKYLENTTPVVQNMPGAGGMIVANWLYNVADPNNTIGSFTVLNNTLLNALTKNEKAQFEIGKFHWLFSTADGADSAYVLWANRTRGLEKVQQLLERNDFVIGSQSAGDVSIQGILLQDVLKVKARFVAGYKDILQAIQSNEIDAYVGSLQSAKTTHREYLTQGNVIHPILQLGRTTRHPDLPTVPTLNELVKGDEFKGILEFFNRQSRLARIYVAPPKADPKMVRKYIEAAHKVEMDPEYQADMRRLNLETKFIHSEELKAIVEGLVSTPSTVLDQIKALSAPTR